MTGKALWVERSHDFLGLCPFGTRCPCCSVPFRRKEKPSWHRLPQRSICPRDKANRLLWKDHSPEPWGADPLPRDQFCHLSLCSGYHSSEPSVRATVPIRQALMTRPPPSPTPELLFLPHSRHFPWFSVFKIVFILPFNCRCLCDNSLQVFCMVWVRQNNNAF